jgi:dipeptidyl aminopeptidase/acylaminoacyl peptidase
MSVMTIPSTTLYPAKQGTRPLTAQDLWNCPRVGAPVPSPDGKTIAVTVTTYDLEKNAGRARIWLVPAAGGEPRALTAPEFSSSEPTFSADGKRLAFTRKVDGGKPQLYVMPLDGGEPQKLTDLPLGAFDPHWLPDDSGIVFATQIITGHATPEATKTEIERRDKDPVKAHVTEERVYRFWDTWLTTGETTHLFAIDLASGAIRDLMPESAVGDEFADPAIPRRVWVNGFESDEQGSYVRDIRIELPVACLKGLVTW